MDSWGGTGGGGYSTVYRDVTGQARNGAPHCPAADWLGVAGEMGSFLLKVPSPHGLEKMALLYLYCLGAACGWAGWGRSGSVR